MKKFFAALAIGALLPATVFAAYTPGTYIAKLDTNIRSMPSMSGTLIGHFNKGDTVTVLKVVGSWCRVAYKYTSAYVYCNLLAPADGSTMAPLSTANASLGTVVTNGLVTKNLQDTQNWLLTNNAGADYINNSYFQSRDLALNWDGEARIADFYFQWPLLADSKCSLTFSGPFHASEIFKAACFDQAGALKTWKENIDTPQQAFDLPRLPFKSYVVNLLADKNLMASFDTYFADSQKVKGLFRLYKDANGVQIWEGKFIDELSGHFMIVSADASQTTSSFKVEKGTF